MAVISPPTYQQLVFKNRPYLGETHSGDKVVVLEGKEQILLAIIDGLGHGEDAHEMSEFVAEKLKTLTLLATPNDILLALNRACTSAVVAAVGIGIIDKREKTFTYSAIGNISAYILSQNSYAFVSRDGSIGTSMRNPFSQTKRLLPGNIIVLHSDGIMSRFYSQYEPSILKSNPDMILDYIFTNYDKKHDDASCIVYRY